ncbi:MAG: sulfite reductase flavoprotein subunit alpha [Bacteroidales bacterium]
MKPGKDILLSTPGKESLPVLDEPSLHVIFGSRTGNSEAAARLAHDFAVYLGIKSYLHNMKTIDFSKIQQMKNIMLAVSKHGEGDPPAVIEKFYEFIHSSDAPSLKGTRFSVLALGDSSYKDFCRTGHDFRRRLQDLGSEEISPLMECDIDYEENAMNWVREAVSAFETILPKTGMRKKGEFAFGINKKDTGSSEVFYAKVKEIQLLTNPDFQKRTFHLVLSMDKFKTPFAPGDSFGIYANNSRLLVDRLLKILKFDGTHAVNAGKSTKLLKEALISNFEITVLTPLVVEKYAAITQSPKLMEFMSQRSDLELYCESCDVLDLVTDFPAIVTPEVLVSVLRKLSPRLYSVANSPHVFPHEVHFTVGLMEYSKNNRRHIGVCSNYFSDRISIGDSIPIILEVNESFRLTEDDSTPVIMIATGTGIAPFRGFLQYRDYKGANGDSWLFFGDRHVESDFLYRSEMEDFMKRGVLTRLDTAFSRDQQQKIYVQHRMLQHSKEIFHWIHERGAEVYLCGNKRTMGKDVKDTLEKIVAGEGKFTRAQAGKYLRNLKASKKLKADLY